MLISTRLKIAALVPSLLALAIAAGVFVSYRKIDTLENQKKTAYQISEIFNELNSLVRSYALYRGERSKRQFALNHDAVSRLIASVDFKDPEHRKILQETARRSDMVKSLFLKLVSNQESVVSGEEFSLSQQAEERLVGQILIRSRDAITHASLLAGLIGEDIADRQRSITILVFALFLAATVSLTVALLQVTRSITEAISRVRRGTEVVGAGNLDHRIGMETDDEIGRLSRAFDAMTGQLQSTTVSRDKLAAEVTERKRAEEALRRSQSLLADAEELSHAGAWEWDLAGDRWFFSDEWMRIHGCAGRSLSTEELLRVVHADDRPAVEQTMENVRKNAAPYNLEHRINRQNTGEVRTVRVRGRIEQDPQGTPMRVVGVTQDITEQKQVEEALLRNRDHLATLSEIVSSLLMGHDPQTSVESLARRVMAALDCQLFFNFLHVPAEGKLRLNAYTGIPSEEAAKIEWLDIGKGICGSVARDGSRFAVEHVQSGSDPRTELLKGYGVRAYVCQPLLSTGGSVIGTMSFGTRTRDRFSDEELDLMKTVSDHIAIAMEHKRADEQLRHLNETLEQRVVERTAEVRQLADQLRALASDLSRSEQRERKRLAKLLHDHIQQLLVAARMCVELIRPVSRSEQVKFTIKELDSILKDAIDASRTLTVELSPPVLSQAGLMPALNWLSETMAEKNNFEVRVQSDDRAEPEEEEVRFLLFECVRELLFNALKHSGERKAAVTALRTQDAQIKIVVEDKGRGFDPAQLRPSGRGASTFGLFSVQERLVHIGGSVSIETVPGRGTRVTILVPIGEGKPPSNG